MRMIVFAIVIGYITGALGYLRYSKKDGKQKAKNLLLWLIIVILQIAILLFGASGVYKVGIEEYWIHTGKINKVNEVRGFFSSFMRVTALTTFLTYLINGIIYFVKSKEETYVKIKKILKWQLLVAIVLTTTLTIAKIL